MATALFQYLSSQYSEPILTINIDGNSTNTNAFLKSIGFEHFTSQHEMEMGLST
jgi:hypothetical protein